MKLVLSAGVVVLSAAMFAAGTQVVGASGTEWEGRFAQRWSAGVEGDLVGLEMAGDRVYAVTHTGSTLEVVAFDRVDGSVLWRHPIREIADLYGYSGAATDYGLLFTFGDLGAEVDVVVATIPGTSTPEAVTVASGVTASAAPCAHLMLLDPDSGEIQWDDPLYSPAPWVGGKVNDHVAVVGVYDDGPAFVDLDSGESTWADYEAPDWVVVGDELGRIDGGSLEVGWDPFDPAAPTRTVRLPKGSVAVTADSDGRTRDGSTLGVAASSDGRLIVATVGSELVGIVDGAGAWRWTPDLEQISGVFLVDDFIGVQEFLPSSDPDDMGGYVERVQVGRIGDGGVEAWDPLPNTIHLDDASFGVDGNVALVGVMDETPGMRSRDERVSAVSVDLREGTPVHEFADDLNGFGTVGAFAATSTLPRHWTGRLTSTEADTLELATSIPLVDEHDVGPPNLIVGDNEMIIHNPEQSTLSAYA